MRNESFGTFILAISIPGVQLACRGVIFLTLLLALPLGLVFAQNRNTGEIRGTVLDATGASLPDVTVRITNTLTGVIREVQTNVDGIYIAPLLETGSYSIAFAKEQFKRHVRSSIVLHVETITINATLELGELTQEVTVQEAAPVVQTETSERRSTITAQTIVELPLVGRGWFALTGLLPGVNGGGSGAPSAGQDASGPGVGVNGTGSFQINWLIDGGVGTMPVSQNPGEPMPLEAISEVTFSTSNFGAEYGAGVAVFNVMTKSGTNRWHGSLFEFVQNDKLMARNFFAPKVQPLRWNQFGGTLGGPIKRDKAFFFFSFQRNPIRAPTTSFFTYPTAEMRAGDFSAPGLPTVYDPASLAQVDGRWVRSPFPGNRIPSDRIDPVAANIQQYFPAPNRPGLTNNFFFGPSPPGTITWYSWKGDYNISAGNRLTFSGSYSPGDGFVPAPTCPMDCYSVKRSQTNGQITNVWTISPAVVNEFRSSATRVFSVYSSPNMGQGFPGKIGLKNAPADVFPFISIGGTVPTSIGGGLSALLAQTSYAQSDTLTWVKGKHILKFGGEFDKWQQNLAWDDIRSGDFTFSGLFTRNPADPSSSGLGYADFLLGQPQSWGVNMPPETGARNWNVQLFVQDDYKLKPNFTLNLGLRYQLQTGWTEVYDRLASFDPELINPATGTPGALWFAGQRGRRALQNTVPDFFAPRIGFAWSPRNRWSIRGNYGIFGLMWGANTYTTGLGTGYSIQGFRTTTDLLTPIFRLADGPPTPLYPSPSRLTPNLLNGQNVSYFPYDTPTAYFQQWQLDVQHELKPGWLVEAAYVGTRGVHLGFGRDINQVPAHLLGPGDAQRRRPYPQFLQIYTAFFDGISKYHSLQFTVKKQFAGGLSFLTNYTFSKTLDSGTGSGWGGTQNIDGGYQNANNWRENYGLASGDMPHLWNGAFIYELPVGLGKRFLNRAGVANSVLGQWQIASTWQVHSGIPFTPVMSGPNLTGSLTGSWRPNRLREGSVANPTIDQWFDTTAFVQPAPFTFGNSGRNILRGPGFANWNASLAKNFRLGFLGESGRLQIKADALNVLNHVNFGMPNRAIGSAAAGTIRSALTSRRVQLGVTLSF